MKLVCCDFAGSGIPNQVVVVLIILISPITSHLGFKTLKFIDILMPFFPRNFAFFARNFGKNRAEFAKNSRGILQGLYNQDKHIPGL